MRACVASLPLPAALAFVLFACSTSDYTAPASDTGAHDSMTAEASGGDTHDATAPGDVGPIDGGGGDATLQSGDDATDESSETPRPTGDDGSDASSPDAASPDALADADAPAEVDASSGDDGADAASCPESMDTYCPDAGRFGFCGVRDWSTAQQPSTWCNTSSSPGGSPHLYPHCDAFNVIVVNYRDTLAILYYDIPSSQLVRIEGPGPGRCVAGQPGPVAAFTSTGALDCWDGAAVAPLSCAPDAASD